MLGRVFEYCLGGFVCVLWCVIILLPLDKIVGYWVSSSGGDNDGDSGGGDTVLAAGTDTDNNQLKAAAEEATTAAAVEMLAERARVRATWHGQQWQQW
jgi:hypothetical protein